MVIKLADGCKAFEYSHKIAHYYKKHFYIFNQLHVTNLLFNQHKQLLEHHRINYNQ